jgi:hypothetical protein
MGVIPHTAQTRNDDTVLTVVSEGRSLGYGIPRRLAVAGGLLVLLAVLTACTSDDTYLPALLADPMAGYSHPSLEVDFRAETPKAPNPIWGGESEAKVTTGFVLDGDAGPVINDIISTAEAAGWVFASAELEVGPQGYRGWSASKELVEGLAAFSVTLGPPNAGEDWDLAIRISFIEEF